MKHRIISLSTERSRAVHAVTALLAAVAVAVAVAVAMLFRIQIDTDPENMLPPDQADRVFHNQVEATFVLHDAIVVGLVNETDPNGIYNAASLSRLHALSEGVLTIDGIIAPDLMSLAVADKITQTDAGELRFLWLMRA